MSETTLQAGPGAPLIGLAGSGALYAALAAALGERGVRLEAESGAGPGDAAGCAMVIALADGEALATRWPGAPWLPVRVESGWVLIGPAALPGEPGCPSCAQRRRRGARADAQAREIALREHGTSASPNSLVTALIARTVAALVVAEADQLLRGRTRCALLRVCLRTGAVRRHALLPDPRCPDCGTTPADSRESAIIHLQARPKPDPATFRIRQLAPVQDELERLYVDSETGVIASLAGGSAGGGATASARIRPGWAGDDSRHGYGRTGDFRSARLTAVLEALERLSGSRPLGRRIVVHAPYAQVAEHALDPRTLGLYPDRWYEQPDFRFHRFTPSTRPGGCGPIPSPAPRPCWSRPPTPTTAPGRRRTRDSCTSAPTAARSAPAWKRRSCTGCWRSPNATRS